MSRKRMIERYRRHASVPGIALILLGLFGGTTCADELEDDPDVRAAGRLFSAWMESQLAYRGIPGVVARVVAGDATVWSANYGYADVAGQRPMTQDTRFRMASHSKLFTATAIMQLREEGKLRLDDPVVDYLPWFKPSARAMDAPPITIEHLLTHSSGLPREAGPHWTELDFPTPEAFIALTPDRVAAYPPETRWKYSNYAYTLAGMIIEAVSGATWADYLQENIFAPLGMDASSVDEDDGMLATGYGRRMPDGSRAIVPFVDARSMAAAVAIRATPPVHGFISMAKSASSFLPTPTTPIPEKSPGSS
ncbi:MAG: serine hydrolase domain-containing protein [Pseudomonadota bacterium]